MKASEWLRKFYNPEEIAEDHAVAAWKRGQKWECLCPSCQKFRDALQIIPCVEPEDDHTW